MTETLPVATDMPSPGAGPSSAAAPASAAAAAVLTFAMTSAPAVDFLNPFAAPPELSATAAGKRPAAPQQQADPPAADAPASEVVVDQATASRTPDGLFHCTSDGCNEKSESFKSRTKHRGKDHKDEPKYICDVPVEGGICGEGFGHYHHYTYHFDRTHSDRPWTCNLCAFVTTSRNSLSRHVRNKHKNIKPKPHKCDAPNCDARFKTKGELNKHINSEHRTTSKAPKRKQSEVELGENTRAAVAKKTDDAVQPREKPKCGGKEDSEKFFTVFDNDVILNDNGAIVPNKPRPGIKYCTVQFAIKGVPHWIQRHVLNVLAKKGISDNPNLFTVGHIDQEGNEVLDNSASACDWQIHSENVKASYDNNSDRASQPSLEIYEDLPGELWKPALAFRDHAFQTLDDYLASNFARIRHVSKNTIVKGWVRNGSNIQVKINQNNFDLKNIYMATWGLENPDPSLYTIIGMNELVQVDDTYDEILEKMIPAEEKLFWTTRTGIRAILTQAGEKRIGSGNKPNIAHRVNPGPIHKASNGKMTENTVIDDH